MEFSFRAQGDFGEARVGYQPAVEMRDWYFTCTQDTLGVTDWNLEAVVKSANKFWSTQRPTEVRLLMQPGVWWVWREVTAVRGTPSIVGSKIGIEFRGNFEIYKGA